MNSLTGMTERKAAIFNIQKYNVYDGPGIRTLIFFKGCPLRCKWCANPEGMKRSMQIMFKKNNCVNCGKCVNVCPQGLHVFSKEEYRHVVDRSKQCIGCHKCVDVCPTRALEQVGEDRTISELLDIIKEDRVFYENSGGGVTLGGGEVTAQPEAAVSLLQACQREGINTAIETCGYTRKEDMARIAEFVDLFLYDIKQVDTFKHNRWTGVHNERILDNLEMLLHNRCNVKIRMPLIHGANTSPEDIQMVIDFLTPYKEYKNLKGVDLLPYHKMGTAKYPQLDMDYPMDREEDAVVPEDVLRRIENQFLTNGFEVHIIQH